MKRNSRFAHKFCTFFCEKKKKNFAHNVWLCICAFDQVCTCIWVQYGLQMYCEVVCVRVLVAHCVLTGVDKLCETLMFREVDIIQLNKDLTHLKVLRIRVFCSSLVTS